VALAIAATNLTMTSGGQPVAWLSIPDGSGLLFYGKGTDSRYTACNIYWLAPGPGLAMSAQTNAAPAPVETNRTFAENLHIEKDTPGYFDQTIYTNETADFWSGTLPWLQLQRHSP